MSATRSNTTLVHSFDSTTIGPAGEITGPPWLEPALAVIRKRYFWPGAEAGDYTARQWLRAAGAALAERLGPVLSEAVERCQVAVPRGAWATLMMERLRNERRLARQRVALEELVLRLAGRVLVVPFKGPSLAGYYPDPLVRESSDIDLLVPRSGLAEAVDVLEGAGYRRWAGGGLDGGYALSFQRDGDGEGDAGVAVDLHPCWHEIDLDEGGGRVRVGDSWQSLVRGRIGQIECLQLPGHVQLYLVAAHTVLHGHRTLSVYLDVAVLLRALEEGSVGAAAFLACQNGRERHLRHALTVAADLFGTDLTPFERSLPGRVGVPVRARVGCLGSRHRFLPGSLVMELLLRRGWRRKLAFARWVLGHRGGHPVGSGGEPRAGLGRLRALRWLGGTLIRYRLPEMSVAESEGGGL